MGHSHAVRKVLVANGMQSAMGVHICIIYNPGTQVTASMNKKAIVDFNGKPSPYRIIFMPEWRGEFGMKNDTQEYLALLVHPSNLLTVVV